jgi:hypothetical protein
MACAGIDCAPPLLVREVYLGVCRGACEVVLPADAVNACGGDGTANWPLRLRSGGPSPRKSFDHRMADSYHNARVVTLGGLEWTGKPVGRCRLASGTDMARCNNHLTLLVRCRVASTTAALMLLCTGLMSEGRVRWIRPSSSKAGCWHRPMLGGRRAWRARLCPMPCPLSRRGTPNTNGAVPSSTITRRSGGSRLELGRWPCETLR